MIVLIAEDNALLAFMMEQALAERGHKVLGPTGRVSTALQLCDRTRPDIALVDIDLEGERTGVDLAHELRGRWSTPTLFTTGQVADARSHSDAAIGVLPKPFTPSTIVKAVSRIEGMLRGSPVASPAPEVEWFQGAAARSMRD